MPALLVPPALSAALIETPIGAMRLIASATGLRVCDFADRKNLTTAVAAAAAAVRGATADDAVASSEAGDAGTILDAARSQLDAYFAGRLRTFTVPLEMPAGVFARRAWDALRAIPFGETRSYAQQAVSIGSPSAVRAVANANGQNYLAILVPCHRVIGSNGTLTGYGGGLERKRWLLDHESSGLFSRR